MWLSPDSLHVYCMSPSAVYGSVCHMFTCCLSMYDLGEGAEGFAFATTLHCLRDQDLTFAIFNCEIMDLEWNLLLI